MGKDSAPYTPPPTRVLTPEEQARVLDKMRALETAAMFTADWDRVSELLWSWRWSARLGRLSCADVPAIAAEFKRWGVG